MTSDRRKVAAAFLAITMELMADPTERAKFEAWKAEREREAAVNS